MSTQEQTTQAKKTNLKSVASVVPSVVAAALAVLSIIFSLLAALCLNYSSGSVHLTTEAALVIFSYIAIMGFGFLLASAAAIWALSVR
ncbi:MAG: hypothetical protein K6F45_00170 [Saccharofermentans sp.]|nr:hypothetical protein [Saccharofermentans sp.]